MWKIWILFLLLPSFVLAQQPVYFTLFGGAANYQGDLRNKRFAVDQTQAAFGLGLKYDLNPHFALRTGITLTKIEGDDEKNIPSLRYRNLNFQSKIIEWNVMLEYSLTNLQEKHFSPYVFAGVGVFHFDPYTHDSLGNKFYLQRLGTEGQGLPQYPDRKMYKLTQLNLPFGGGIRFAVGENVVMGYEIGFRKLFTDYLDDVSKTYADRSTLAQGRGEKTVELAYRAGELKGGNPNYPSVNLQRGKAELKDWYYFQGITLSININAFNGFGSLHSANGNKGRVSCPKVW
jgi:hypothetical protein